MDCEPLGSRDCPQAILMRIFAHLILRNLIKKSQMNRKSSHRFTCHGEAGYLRPGSIAEYEFRGELNNRNYRVLFSTFFKSVYKKLIARSILSNCLTS